MPSSLEPSSRLGTGLLVVVAWLVSTLGVLIGLEISTWCSEPFGGLGVWLIGLVVPPKAAVTLGAVADPLCGLESVPSRRACVMLCGGLLRERATEWI